MVRYDNERPKGDHRHRDGQEEPYELKNVETPIRDFLADVETRKAAVKRITIGIRKNTLMNCGLITRTEDGKIQVPYEVIHADFDLCAVA